jgi:hypothetical protein
MTFALKPIDSLEKTVGVFYLVFDEGPELFEERGEVFGLLLGFL